MNSHFYSGGFYPKGGASEIALNIIPVIEKSGGKVLVRANVTGIVHNGNKVTGVKVNTYHVVFLNYYLLSWSIFFNYFSFQVEKGDEVCEINAPVVISNAGLYNTFQR